MNSKDKILDKGLHWPNLSRDEGCGRKRAVAIVIVHTFVSDFFLCELVRGLQVLVLLFFVVMATLSSSPFSI